MPTYSYACTECGNKFDIHQSFSDDSLSECPECQGKLRKLFNSVGIVFKGSGFYRTDSRNGSSSSESSGKSESDKSTSGTSGSGSSSSGSGASTKDSGASSSSNGSASSSSSSSTSSVTSGAPSAS